MTTAPFFRPFESRVYVDAQVIGFSVDDAENVLAIRAPWYIKGEGGFIVDLNLHIEEGTCSV